VWGTTFARGSGVDYNGDLNATKGLLLSRYNYGIGVQLAIPLLRFKDVRLQLQQQELILQSNKENLSQAEFEVTKQTALAESTYQNALKIASETPLQLQAANHSFNALQSRYKAGLIDFSALLQAQYNLSKAEADLKKSYLEVWKALLFKSAVTGNLNIFLNAVK
jgi:outer membrane protein TolC